MNQPDHTVLEALARAFALPSAGGGGELIDTLAANRLAMLRRRLLRAAPGASWQDSLVAFEIGRGSAWRPEMGLVGRALATGSADGAALQWALAAAAAGGEGRLAAYVDDSCQLALEGRLFPVRGEVSVVASKSGTEVQWDSGATTFVRDTCTWQDRGEVRSRWPVHRLPGFSPGTVSTTDLSLTTSGAFPWGQWDAPQIVAPTAVPPVLADAFALLDDAAPRQARWICTALRSVLVVGRGLTPALVCSDGASTGMAAIAPPESLLHCAEILVQEATRQQMLAVLAMATLVDESVSETWYSPISRLYLSTLRLLSDAHIHANTALLYGVLVEKVVLDAAATRRHLRAKILFREQCRPALRKSPSLTLAGKAFWGELDNALGPA